MQRPGTWEENLGSHGPAVQAAARGLEAAIRDQAPDLVVHYDAGNGLLAFGRSMKMRDLLFALIPHARWVNLQLADGALLQDAEGRIEGTGKRIRHIKVRSGEDAESPAVRRVIEAQLAARPGGAAEGA